MSVPSALQSRDGDAHYGTARDTLGMTGIILSGVDTHTLLKSRSKIELKLIHGPPFPFPFHFDSLPRWALSSLPARPAPAGRRRRIDLWLSCRQKPYFSLVADRKAGPHRVQRT